MGQGGLNPWRIELTILGCRRTGGCRGWAGIGRLRDPKPAKHARAARCLTGGARAEAETAVLIDASPDLRAQLA